MGTNRVVVRFKNGSIKKGSTNDFFPNKAMFHLKSATGEVLDIQTEELKSVFFVKNYQGDKDRRDDYSDAIPGGGRKIQVTFFDDEILIGYSQGYSPNRSGFFVVPADLKNNNERIYVINSATKKVTVL
ncbi:MAG: hypothetical protein ABFR82_15105 [Nitrospirota bacterium]